MNGDGFVRELRLTPPDGPAPRSAYPWRLPAVAAVAGRPAGLALHPAVTYLVGENGSGKSTLLEAVAVAAGINPEGGSTNFSFATRESHSEVGEHAIRLVRGARRPRTDFFLRAESLFTAATYLDDLSKVPLGRQSAGRLRRYLVARAVPRRVVPSRDAQPLRPRRLLSAR